MICDELIGDIVLFLILVKFLMLRNCLSNYDETKIYGGRSLCEKCLTDVHFPIEPYFLSNRNRMI